MICLVAGRRVLVQEARMGGVVAQPLTDWPPQGWDRPESRVPIVDLATAR